MALPYFNKNNYRTHTQEAIMAFTTLKDLGISIDPSNKEKYDNFINGQVG